MNQNTQVTRGRKNWRYWLGIGLLMASLGWFSTNKAEAVPPILRQGNHAGSYHFSIGPSVLFAGLGTGAYGYIANSIGYHLNGTSHGPAIGGNFDLAFGGAGVGMVFAGRFWWDIPVARRMAVYIAPFIQPGLGLLIAGSGVGAFFDLQFGVEGKVTLHRRLLLTLRPIAFDLQIGGSGVGALVLFSLHFMHFGIGVTF